VAQDGTRIRRDDGVCWRSTDVIIIHTSSSTSKDLNTTFNSIDSVNRNANNREVK
jgi:hypothetical protein